MIAIAASSHALDALYGRVKRELPERPETENRWSTILEELKRAAYVKGSAGGGRWAKELEWLFDLRNAALHYEEKMTPTVPHPSGASSGVENVIYCAEAATRAVDLALEILDTCITAPRPELAAWAGPPLAHVPPDLDARRTPPPSP